MDSALSTGGLEQASAHQRRFTLQAKISKQELQALTTDAVPLAGQLGVEVDEVRSGSVLMRVPYRSEFVRPGGTIAGPVMMALADFAVYGAVLTLIGYVELAVTTNLSINFLRRPKPGDVYAHARILKLGKRLAVGEVLLHMGDEEQLVAHVTATYSIPPIEAR